MPLCQPLLGCPSQSFLPQGRRSRPCPVCQPSACCRLQFFSSPRGVGGAKIALLTKDRMPLPNNPAEMRARPARTCMSTRSGMPASIHDARPPPFDAHEVYACISRAAGHRPAPIRRKAEATAVPAVSPKESLPSPLYRDPRKGRGRAIDWMSTIDAMPSPELPPKGGGDGRSARANHG